jgi:hypothetical protein
MAVHTSVASSPRICSADLGGKLMTISTKWWKTFVVGDSGKGGEGISGFASSGFAFEEDFAKRLRRLFLALSRTLLFASPREDFPDSVCVLRDTVRVSAVDAGVPEARSLDGPRLVADALEVAGRDAPDADNTEVLA